ncbi:MAG: GDSL-type esterase/lipase family protein [Actinomycetota bacterium]|nr:GDSL-type esterase/lipase family protein [Actinomycetota bacterium]
MKAIRQGASKLKLHWRLLGFAVSVSALGLAAAARSVAGVVTAAAFVFVFAVLVRRELRRADRESQGWAAYRTAGAVVALGAAAYAARWMGMLPDGYSFVGIALVYLGVARLVAYWRHRYRDNLLPGVLILIGCTVAFFAGFSLLSPGTPVAAIVAVAAAVLLAPLGLNLLSEHLVRSHYKVVKRARLLAPAGLLAATLGIGILLFAGAPPRFIFPVVAVMAVFLFAVTVDVAADILIFVVALALGSTFMPRAEEPTQAVTPSPGDHVMVTFGDSYSSGEGAKRYYLGTNTRGTNECRRADTAYSPVAARRSDRIDSVVFLACSGALAKHVDSQPQYPDEPIGRPPVYGRRGLPQLWHYEWLRTQPPTQLEVELVVVGIGGNDAGFGVIGQTCVGPGNCAEYGQEWLNELPQVYDQLVRAFRGIHTTFPDRKVLVVPYPIPLNAESDCDYTTLQGRERLFLAGFTEELDNVVVAAADAVGFHVLNEARHALRDENMRICDTNDPDDAGVNFVAWHPVDGEFEQAANPRNWLHNSLHPNAAGHDVVAERLTTWIAASGQLALRRTPLPTTVTSKTLTELGLPEDFDHCGKEGSKLECGETELDWLLDRSDHHLRRVALPLALLAGGLWAVSIAIVRSWRGCGTARRPARTPT